jgi:peptide/nickel transport system permease protein
MVRFVLARLLMSVVLFFAITLFVFVAFFVLPSDQTPRRRGMIAGNVFVRDTYWMHGSMPTQYVNYVWNFVRHGDLGRSYTNRESVVHRVKRGAPVTLSLVIGGAIFWLLIAIPLGVISALRPRSLLDRASTVFVLIGLSAHPVWLGLIGGYLLGYKWHVVPIGGYCDLFTPVTSCGGPTQWVYHLVLPWMIFGLLNAALYTSMIRAVVLEELNQEYVRTARAKGSSDRQVVRKHVAQNVLLPFVTMIGMNMGIALGGVIFIESVFSLPGLGAMFRQGIVQRDLPVTAGIVMFMTIAIRALNLLVDLAYALLDPRIRARRRLAGDTTEPAAPAVRALQPELELPA